MSRASTPRKERTINTSDELEFEFSRHLLRLFASTYDARTFTADLLSLPPVKPVERSQSTKSKALSRPADFNSAICDLRLKKKVDKMAQERRAASGRTEARLNEVRRMLEEDADDIGDIFLPEKVPRPETPVYMQMLAKTQKMEEQRERRPDKRTAGLNISEAEKEFSVRLAKQREKAEERKQKMLEKQKALEHSHMEFLSTLSKKKVNEGGIGEKLTPSPRTSQQSEEPHDELEKDVTPRKKVVKERKYYTDE